WLALCLSFQALRLFYEFRKVITNSSALAIRNQHSVLAKQLQSVLCSHALAEQDCHRLKAIWWKKVLLKARMQRAC
ncbi:hypothetical protein ACGELV_30770, partial [Pseudomonas aeruginosa]